jgi:hypothetical protein
MVSIIAIVDLDRQFYMFFDCAEQIEAFVKADGRNFSSVVWYLITESVPLRRAAVKKYAYFNANS